MKKALSFALMIFGFIVFITTGQYIAVFLFFIGLNLISTEGSEINLDNKTYRTIKSILGINFEKWKPCPEFEYVSVFKTTESTEISSRGATIGTFKNSIIKLNLFYQGNKSITFYKTDNINDAFNVAKHFKLALDIDILDATTPGSKWI